MPRWFLFAVVALVALAPALQASAEVCRSMSMRWSAAGTDYRTQLWESGEAGCKKIEHTLIVDGEIETLTGQDCNCDLKADGFENRVIGAPSSDPARGLGAFCARPTKPPVIGASTP